LEDSGQSVGVTNEALKLLKEEVDSLKSKYLITDDKIEEIWNNIRNNIEFDPYSNNFVNMNIINEEKKLSILKACYQRKSSILVTLNYYLK